MATQTLESPVEPAPAHPAPVPDDHSLTPPHGDPLLDDVEPADEPAPESPEPSPVSAPRRP